MPKTPDTSEPHYLNKKQPTPSHIKRIEKKLDLILESEDERKKKENQNTARKLGQIEHFKRKNALLSEENSKLNARLQECETVKAHNQQLLVDNDNLQKRNKDLGAENSAQLVEIERLSTENCLLRGLLKSDNSRRHKSNRSSGKKKKVKKGRSSKSKEGKRKRRSSSSSSSSRQSSSSDS